MLIGVSAAQSFDELLLLMRGGRTIYWGPLGPKASKLFEHFEVPFRLVVDIDTMQSILSTCGGQQKTLDSLLCTVSLSCLVNLGYALGTRPRVILGSLRQP